jgi:hypothetical protein
MAGNPHTRGEREAHTNPTQEIKRTPHRRSNEPHTGDQTNPITTDTAEVKTRRRGEKYQPPFSLEEVEI